MLLRVVACLFLIAIAQRTNAKSKSLNMWYFQSVIFMEVSSRTAPYG